MIPDHSPTHCALPFARSGACPPLIWVSSVSWPSPQPYTSSLTSISFWLALNSSTSAWVSGRIFSS